MLLQWQVVTLLVSCTVPPNSLVFAVLERPVNDESNASPREEASWRCAQTVLMTKGPQLPCGRWHPVTSNDPSRAVRAQLLSVPLPPSTQIAHIVIPMIWYSVAIDGVWWRR